MFGIFKTKQLDNGSEQVDPVPEVDMSSLLDTYQCQRFAVDRDGSVYGLHPLGEIALPELRAVIINKD